MFATQVQAMLCLYYKYKKEHLVWFISGQGTHSPFIHSIIFGCLSGSQWQQAGQRRPDILLPSHVHQLILGGAQGQMGYVIPPACSGSA